jgi:3'(2'), 5'-bisphosphate nucleotidase
MDSGTGLDPDAVAAELGRIAVEAGRLLAEVADRAGGRRMKEDGSPTTDADLASERLILSALARTWPDIPVVAEESVEDGPRRDLFFLVDPLDGTRDYLGGAGEYSVNIALVSGDRPVAAGICAPSDGRVWIAGSRAAVAPMSDLRVWSLVGVRPTPPEGPTALVSRRHGDPDTEACLHAARIHGRRTASSAYKFCLIASGEADLYVRCGPTMEWDVAAGDHILTRAGGAVLDAERRPLTYGHAGRGYLNGPFAALGEPSLARLIELPKACAELSSGRVRP